LIPSSAAVWLRPPPPYRRRPYSRGAVGEGGTSHAYGWCRHCMRAPPPQATLPPAGTAPAGGCRCCLPGHRRWRSP
ncbi:unnamed protein product, partial [Musa textilis]